MGSCDAVDQATSAYKSVNDHLSIVSDDIKRDDLYAFGKKFDSFCETSSKPIVLALKRAHRRVIENKEGAAFSLPRDGKIWERIQINLADNIKLTKEM